MTFIGFIEKWICCATIDEIDVVDAINVVRSNPDDLAESMIEFTHDAQQRHVTMGNTEEIVVDNSHNVPVATAMQVEDMSTLVNLECEASPASIPGTEWVVPEGRASKVYVNCQDVLEVKRHRRLPHNQKGRYAASVVSEIKNRLGCPTDNAANRLAVRRMATNIMATHGLRPSHVRYCIEKVVSGVFIPDEADIFAAKMTQSNYAAALRFERDNAKPRTVWDSLFGRRRGQSRHHL